MYSRRNKLPEINPKVKPLVAFFLENKIGEYLITKRFKIHAKRFLIDDSYDSCVKAVIRSSTVGVFIEGYTGTDEEAFEQFLNLQFDNMDKKQFLSLLYHILTDFLNWKKRKVTFEKLEESLSFMEYSESEIQELIQELPSQFKISFRVFSLSKHQTGVVILVVAIIATSMAWYFDLLPEDIKILLSIVTAVGGAYMLIPQIIKQFDSPNSQD